MKSLWQNGTLMSLLTAALLGAVGFWYSTGNKLAVHDAEIEALQKQVEKLGEDLDDLAKLVW